MSFQSCVVALLLLSDWKRKKMYALVSETCEIYVFHRENVVLELAAVISKIYQVFNTPGPWLLWISVVRFSIVCIFKKYPKYPAYAIFTT